MCLVEGFLEVIGIAKVSVARPHPFMLEGITKQTEDYIPREWRKEFGDINRTCNWR